MSNQDLRKSLEETTEDVVVNFCQNFASFTSLDVSNKVKQSGHPEARHRDIAAVLRQLFAGDLIADHNYRRDLIDVSLSNGQTAQAFLYHHETVSVDEYNRTNQTAIPPVRQTLEGVVSNPPKLPKVEDLAGQRYNIPVAGTMAQVSRVFSFGNTTTAHPSNLDTLSDVGARTPVTLGETDTRKQRGDHRLEVPPSWANKLGWNDGNTIYAIKNGLVLDLMKANMVYSDYDVIGIFMINKGRILVPKTILRKCGLDAGPDAAHDVELHDDHITIR